MSTKERTQSATLITNRNARRNFHVLETVEAGIELCGTEVKSLRARKANMSDAFARVEERQIYVHNLHISPYEKGNRFNHEPLRKRRLLLHKTEIAKLAVQAERKGRALVPLRLYLKRGRVKVELAVAEGKLLRDKREDVKKREHAREIQRAVAKASK
jgi:SsrA-binding protein